MLNTCYKAIYTCTPRPFTANEWFYMRDTGMLSRVLRGMGVESKVVMPLPWQEGDIRDEHLLRVEMEKLSSDKWWKSLGIDGVVLYSWGDIRYNRVARAIRKAGIRLVIHLDTDGVLPAWVEPDFPKHLSGWYKLARNITYDLLRPRHLRYAHAITCSRELQEHLRTRRFYGERIAGLCKELPTPVHPRFAYNGVSKQERVVCIGQWNEYAKRQDFMMEALSAFLKLNTRAKVDICGRCTPELESWYAALPPREQERVELRGFIDNKELPSMYSRAMVSLCTSRSEGTSIASAEALCCGCSLVATNRPDKLRIVHGYISRSAGTIAREDTPDAVARALHEELTAWRNGERNATAIAAQWQPLFRADKALASVFNSIA